MGRPRLTSTASPKKGLRVNLNDVMVAEGQAVPLLRQEAVNPPDIMSAISHREAVRLARLARDGVVLELGSHLGYSTIVLARTAALVHSVDWHRGDPDAGLEPTLMPFFGNILKYGVADKVVAHIGRFEDILPTFGEAVFDGCFLDGSHDFKAVVADTAEALRVVRVGGWLAWHDWGRFDVTQAIRSMGLGVEVTDHLAWHRKTGYER